MIEREIVGFDRDEDGAWIALLDCRHRRHVRHQPPFADRAWVEDATARQERLGQRIPCLRCAQLQWPDGLDEYRRTRVFDEQTIPAGLLVDHRTAKGVWGRIHVLAGGLDYVLSGLDGRTIPLTADQSAAIPPQLTHHVTCTGSVRFYIAFFR